MQKAKQQQQQQNKKAKQNTTTKKQKQKTEKFNKAILRKRLERRATFEPKFGQTRININYFL